MSEDVEEQNQVREHSTAGIEETSGIPWDTWVSYLDDAGAERLSHTEIARLTYEFMPEHVANRGWWAQGAAIAYEHQKGLRVPGQSSKGDFSASASKTFAGDKDAALVRWKEVTEGLEGLGDVPFEVEPTTSSTEKWRYWRVRLTDGTRATVTISDKHGGKSVVAVQHSGLPLQEDIPQWKAAWKSLLGSL